MVTTSKTTTETLSVFTQSPAITSSPATGSDESVPTTMQSTTYTTESTSVGFTNGTIPVCECADLKRKKIWSCGETWTEDCFHKTCANRKIELTPVVCPESRIPNCPRQQATKVSDGCCETWKCDCKFHYCHFFFFSSSFPFIFFLHGFVVTLPLIPLSQSALTCLSSKRLVGSL